MKPNTDVLEEMIQAEYEKATIGTDARAKALELRIRYKMLCNMYERNSDPEHIADMECTLLTDPEKLQRK